MSFDNNKKHVVLCLLPPISRVIALRSDILLPSAVKEPGTCYLFLQMLV